MATLVSRTISAAQAADFSTWALAEAALPASTIVSDEYWVFTVLDASPSSGATVTGTLMDATHYVEFVGANKASHPGAWGMPAGGASGIIISGAAAYVYLTDVAFWSRVGAGTIHITGTAAVVVCTRVVVYGGADEAANSGSGFYISAAGATLTCNSCMSIDAGQNSGVAGFNVTNGTATFNNCTNLRGANGFIRSAGTATALNCYSYGAVTADYSGTWTLTTCVSADTTANSVGGAGNTQEATPNFIGLRDSRIVFYANCDSYQDTTIAGAPNIVGKRDRNCPGLMLGRSNNPTQVGDGAVGTNGDVSTQGKGWTGTTGYRKYPATGLTMRLNVGSGDRSIGMVLNIITAPITDGPYGWAWIRNDANLFDTLGFHADADGYICCTITDGDGDATTATSTVKVSTLTAGYHYICGVLSGNTLTIYVDGVAVGTGDATGHVTFAAAPLTNFRSGHYNDGSDRYIGANMAVYRVIVYNDDVLYSGMIPYVREGSGWIDDPRLSAKSPVGLQKGGTTAGTPALDLMGVPFASIPSVGCLQYVPNRSGDTHNTGYGLQTHSLQPSNTGFLAVTK